MRPAVGGNLITTALYIILAILAFGFLIFIHEFGHFITARIFGVRVLEFAIGMGPAIFKKRGKRTLYSLRLFPVGGFCALDGEDGESEDAADAEALPEGGDAEKPAAPDDYPPPAEGEEPFYVKPLWQKVIILAAGAFMNFLTGFLILLVLSSRGDILVTTQIDSFMEGFPCEGETMLMPGDDIERINGYWIFTNADILTFLEHEKGAPYTFTVARNGERIDVTVPLERRVYPYETTDENGNPVTVDREMYGLVFKSEEATFYTRIKLAWLNAIDFVRMVKVSLFDLFGGKATVNDLAGPVGISGMIVETAQTSLPSAWSLIAMIAVNLAVMNLLPIPAIDGGRIFFLIVGGVIKLIRGKPLNPKYESAIHFGGLVLLLGLMAYVAFNDILRLVR